MRSKKPTLIKVGFIVDLVAILRLNRKSQDVVEKQRHRREQLQGRPDVLVGAVLVQHVGRVVDDEGGRQADHPEAEPGAERQARAGE